MQVLLLKQNRIEGKAGEIVEVSPDRAAFLLRYGLAAPVTVREQAETPEKRAAARNTRAAKAAPEKEAKAAKAARGKK